MVYYAAVILIIVLNVLFFIILKKRIFFYYILFHITVLLFFLTVNGIGTWLVYRHDAQISDIISALSVPLGFISVLLFVKHFIITRLNRVLDLLVALWGITLILHLLGLTASSSINSHLGSFTILFLLALVLFYSAVKRDKAALFLLFAWSGFAVGALLMTLSGMGVVAHHDTYKIIRQVGIIVEMITVTVYMLYSYLHIEEKHQAAQEKAHMLYELSIIDSLTRLYNRRGFFDKAKTEDIGDYTHAILLIDIDDFKKLNDTHGHDAGDTVLKQFCQTVLLPYQDRAIVARYGGEEFIMLCPIYSAEKFANDILHATRRAVIVHETFTLKITLSIGSAAITDAQALNEAITQADLALYKAKKSGKDKYIYAV
jgi:diguanylate cyclase (GGDEF)-like protein